MRGARIGARNIPIAVLHRPEYNKDRPGDPAESGDGDAEAGTGGKSWNLKIKICGNTRVQWGLELSGEPIGISFVLGVFSV